MKEFLTTVRLLHVSTNDAVFHREYLATFKKTVAMHETFLTRLANHNVFREEHNFKVFLEYDQDVSLVPLLIKSICEMSFDGSTFASNSSALKFYHDHVVI